MSYQGPILPGQAATDYERYLRTDELLALQKTPSEMVHRDELIFQTIHQSSELWLKLACFEIEGAIARLDADDVWGAIRMLRRAVDAANLVTSQTRMLEHLSPLDYHAVRSALGHGSGFDSPGFRQAHHVSPLLGEAFARLCQRRKTTTLDIYRDSHAHEDLFQLAERLVDWDQALVIWRAVHLKMVERVIGGHVIGTQGTPVEVLGRRVDVRYYEDLWDVRNKITRAQ